MTDKNESWKNFERHIQTMLLAVIVFIAQDMYRDWKEIKSTVVTIAANDKQQDRDIKELRGKVFAVLPKKPTHEQLQFNSQE